MSPHQASSWNKWLVLRASVLCTLLAIFVAVFVSVSTAQENDESASAGHAISLMYDIRRAPPAKSMGLLQGNFLDAVSTGGSLQLALVIDSTESMTDQLEAVRANLPNMIGDLDRLMDGGLQAAVVSYADIGVTETPARTNSSGFTADTESIQETIAQLQPKSGRPYFPECVDVGVHRALTELPWSDDDVTEKWILLIGDAPPYDASFTDDETNAKRWYETDLLIDLANQKGIKVHCLLCNSRQEEKLAFESELDKTREFMGRLSSETGGKMLDLSYELIRKELAASASRLRTEYVRIGHITEQDIRQAQGDSDISDSGDTIRIAICPLVDFDSMTFFIERPEVHLATELRQILKTLPNTRVISPRNLEQEISRLKSEGIPPDDWPQALCYRLRAQFILSGEMRTSRGSQAVTARLHGPQSKEAIATVEASSETNQLAAQLLGQFAVAQNPSAEVASLILRLREYASAEQIDQSQNGYLAELTAGEKSLLLAALEALEQSVDYSLGDPSGKSLLDAAEEKLAAFLRSRDQSAFAYALLASVYFNQANVFERMGQTETAKQKFAACTDAIQQAFSFRDQLLDPLIQLEVEADYHLHVRQQFQESIDRYETILSRTEASPLDRSLRAHWMLAGIRSGDWGADSEPAVIDLQKARNHLIQILAFWPESSLATTVRRHLLWDGKNNKSRNPYFPREGEVIIAGD